MQAITQRLVFALRAFDPDLIFLSAGFDGAKHDIGNKRHGNRLGNTGLDLTPADFHWITEQIQRVANVCCEGRIISCLEGGYGRVDPSTTPSASSSAASSASSSGTGSGASTRSPAACETCALDLEDFVRCCKGHLAALAGRDCDPVPPSPAAASRGRQSHGGEARQSHTNSPGGPVSPRRTRRSPAPAMSPSMPPKPHETSSSSLPAPTVLNMSNGSTSLGNGDGVATDKTQHDESPQAAQAAKKKKSRGLVPEPPPFEAGQEAGNGQAAKRQRTLEAPEPEGAPSDVTRATAM